MNIVLIGYRGTGKSTVAELLAKRLGMNVVSTDKMIVERAGKSIPEIVASSGWDYFRDLEAEVIKQVSQLDNVIVDAGGGVIIRDANTQNLKKNGIVFWLTASVPTIAKRIKADTQRPSLTGAKSFVEEIEEVLAQRIPLYRSASDYEISTECSINEVVERIIEIWKRKGEEGKTF